MNQTLEQYAQALEERVAQDTLRQLRPSRTLANGLLEISGKPLVNFASNDYLGLSQHPTLVARSQEFAARYGVGSGASRLLSGNLAVFDEIEAKLARLKGSEAALILPSGFQANSSVIPSILTDKSLAAADRLIHRSMIEGILLSGTRWFRYKHNDFADLEQKLEKQDGSLKSRWLFTESVFSMDGDQCRLDNLLLQTSSRGLALYIDEAHATGVFGKDGMGMTAGLNFTGITMGTFGKGLGSFGSYICCSAMMREYLVNFCPGLIYSTALPPPVLGAIDAALDLVPSLNEERQRLQHNSEYLRVELGKMGYDTGASSTQIVPVLLGSAISALRLSAFLEEAGFYIPAIRPPTVAEGSARLRLSLTSVHTKVQLDDLLKALRSWHEKKN